MPPFDFVLANRYRLLGPLGEGGMAAVYRGRDLRLNREVAIKILREDFIHDQDFLARFQREAEVVASLSHPNIVPVYDIGEEHGSHFIVMEYVRGRTLKEALESNGPLPPERAAQIMSSVLGALGYAHGRGLIHRDVKPQNILLTPDGTARLADFGIVHRADSSTTRTAAILGSAHYLSPEQLRGEEATVQSDVYASGAVLYEMLAGTPPFDGPNALAVANQHLHAEVPALSQETPAAISAAVLRALAKEPGDRFPDTESFASAIKPLTQDAESTTVFPAPNGVSSPIQAQAEATGPHPSREMVLRRSARKTGLLTLVLGLLVVGAAYAAGRQYWGHQLPSYPSVPYALVPVCLGVALLLWWLSVRSWSYTMDGNAAVIQWGLLGHHRFGVPVRYITTLELKQSPIDRVLGVGTVELCARDQHGRERRLIMEDLPHPRESYEELMRLVGRALRARPTFASDESPPTGGHFTS
jgi:tRNA A-37 threonylcarbamoyl transferase component Bud32/membrane protein YdbS with pleckstrin-like domain